MRKKPKKNWIESNSKNQKQNNNKNNIILFISIFKVIKKAGHLPCVEQPNEVGSIFLQFLENNK